MKDVFENYGSTAVDFGNKDVQKKISAINGGAVGFDSERVKLGKESLKWNYRSGSILRMTDCSVFSQLNEYPGAQGIKLWIYNPEGIDADLTVRIGKSKLVCVAPAYRFKVHMSFSGWRAVWIRLNISAKTMVTNVLTGLDAFEIEAPENVSDGVVYFDAFEVLESVSYLQCADFQMPYLPLWSTGIQYEVYKRIPTEAEELCSEEYKSAFKVISDRLDNYIIPQNVDYQTLADESPVKIRYNGLQELIADEIKRYDEYNITRGRDGKMYGPGLFAATDNDKPHRFIEFEKIWVSLALDRKLNQNKESLRKIVELFDYFNEQGWAEGSACGSIAFDEMRADGYAYALYMLRDELREAGIFEREWATLRWRSEFGYVFAYRDEDIAPIVMMTCDKMRSLVLYQLIYILGLEDSPLKVHYMKKYTEYLRYVTAPKKGIENGIKSDYTLWHHQGPYMTAYGAEALNVLCLIRYLLHDTCFEMDNEGADNLNNVLTAYRRSAFGNDIPALRLCGRFPGQKGTMLHLMTAYGAMAACGSEEMADIFAQLWDESSPELQAYFKGRLPAISWMETPGQLKLFDEIMQKRESTVSVTEGHFVFPYGGYCVYRQKNWMLAISGWSSYIWDFESGAGENLYGRYINYGSAVIASDKKCFDASNGLDWNNIPGATAKYLPDDELVSEGNSTNRYHSDETFLGGVTSGEKSGIYAMKLHDTAFDTTFRAKKSWFCFDDMIICIGTGIKNSDSEHRTETTLFQCETDDESILPVNGAQDCIWVTDSYGNGYIIPRAENFKMTKNRQSLKLGNGEECTGCTTVAYIDHSYAPQNEDYEYAIMPMCSEETLEAEAKALRYRVLKKDESLHIVACGAAVGYAIFDADALPDCGAVKKTDTPCVVMETRLSDDEILINVADPDLRMCDFPIKTNGKHMLKITLTGRWKVAQSSQKITAEVNDDETAIIVGCIDGKQTDIKLTLWK